MAKLTHPDKFPNDQLKQAQFAEISAAYEILSDTGMGFFINLKVWIWSLRFVYKTVIVKYTVKFYDDLPNTVVVPKVTNF